MGENGNYPGVNGIQELLQIPELVIKELSKF
jgi:hypothetical protein